MLELVCWSDELAVSEMEKNGTKASDTSLAFHYPNGLEMEKYKKWLEDWQKLPYISPYQNSMHLASKSDESDKWIVAVLHEVLNLFVGKKAEVETLLSLGEFWGLRSRFKLAMLQHPGIFYVTRKTGMQTVVLRESYRRGMLIERHPLVDVRMKYAKLMNAEKAGRKLVPKQEEDDADADVELRQGQESDNDGIAEEEDDVTSSDSCDENHLKANVAKRGRLRWRAA